MGKKLFYILLGFVVFGLLLTQFESFIGQNYSESTKSNVNGIFGLILFVAFIVAFFVIIKDQSKSIKSFFHLIGNKLFNKENKKTELNEKNTSNKIWFLKGTTKEFLFWNLGIIIVIGLISVYVENASGQGNAPLAILMLIFVIASIPMSIMVALARLRYLKLNAFLLIIMFVPIANIVFFFVLLFLKPKESANNIT